MPPPPPPRAQAAAFGVQNNTEMFPVSVCSCPSGLPPMPLMGHPCCGWGSARPLLVRPLFWSRRCCSPSALLAPFCVAPRSCFCTLSLCPAAAGSGAKQVASSTESAARVPADAFPQVMKVQAAARQHLLETMTRHNRIEALARHRAFQRQQRSNALLWNRNRYEAVKRETMPVPEPRPKFKLSTTATPPVPPVPGPANAADDWAPAEDAWPTSPKGPGQGGAEGDATTLQAPRKV